LAVGHFDKSVPHSLTSFNASDGPMPWNYTAALARLAAEPTQD
jgi:hypothetical protein